MNYEENFDKFVQYCWSDPEKPESPDKLSIQRQKQLEEILKRYGGKAVPLSHFSDRKCPACGHPLEDVYVIHNPTNYEIFPVVYAYLCGVLVRNEHQLELKDGIELVPDRKAPFPSHMGSESSFLF